MRNYSSLRLKKRALIALFFIIYSQKPFFPVGLMDEICRSQRFDFRQGDDAFRMVDAFQEPRHVVRQRTHRLEAFFVLADIVGCQPMDAVPVLRCYNRHVRLHEVLQKAVVGGAGTAATGRDDGRGRLII